MNQKLVKAKLALQKEAPILMSLTGISGFITGAIMAAKATPKALEILEEHEPYLPPEGKELIWEQFKLIAPVYAPTVGMLAISAAFVLGSTQLSKYRYGAATTLYLASQQSLSRLQDAVLQNVGPKQADVINADASAPPRSAEVPSIVILGEDSLFWDVFSARYFHADSIETVRKIINDMNAKMYSDGWVSINEFYDALVMPEVQYGDYIGWSVEQGPIEPRFSTKLTEKDRPCISLNFWDPQPKHMHSQYGEG